MRRFVLAGLLLFGLAALVALPAYGTSPGTNDAAALRLAGALLIEQNDEWLVSRKYLSAESIALALALALALENEDENDRQREEVIELTAA